MIIKHHYFGYPMVVLYLTFIAILWLLHN